MGELLSVRLSAGSVQAFRQVRCMRVPGLLRRMQGARVLRLRRLPFGRAVLRVYARGVKKLTEFADLEKIVLDRIQRDFPPAPDPFAEMARELSIDRDEFLSTARSLKKRGIIRNIAAIFNTGRLGYV